jgi:hypothetical protein
MTAHGVKRFEITNLLHIPRKGEIVYYSDSKFIVIDVVYDYDESTIYIYCRLL